MKSTAVTDKQAALVPYNPNQFNKLTSTAKLSRQTDEAKAAASVTYPLHQKEAIPSGQMAEEKMEETERLQEAVEQIESNSKKENSTDRKHNGSAMNLASEESKESKATTSVILSKNPFDEARKNTKDRANYHNLSAFINVCCQNDWANHANNVLSFYHRSCKDNRNKLKNVQLFAIVLDYNASKGNLKRINSILKVLEEDRIPLTPQIYAKIIECLGREPTAENTTQLRSYMKEAESNVSGYCMKKTFTTFSIELHQT